MLDDVIAQLKALRLYGMAQALADLAADPAAQSQPPAHWVRPLADAERADRQARTLRDQMKTARFPLHRDLATFDFQDMPIRLAQATPTGSGTVLLPPTSATERVSTGEFGWTHAPAPLLATR